jgi:uncharacterized protein YcfJ
MLAFILWANSGLGQEPVHTLDDLKKVISVGNSVRVIDKSGNEINGKVENISSDSLILNGRRISLPANSIRELQKRRNDPWWNGFLIGGGIGAAAGLLVAQAQCGGNDSECAAIAKVAFIPAGMAIGMATGALIDRSIARYDTVYRSNSATTQPGFQVFPIISQKQKGLRLRIAF